MVTSLGGGLPVLVNGQIAGAIGASGVTAEQDMQVAKAGLAALTNAGRPPLRTALGVDTFATLEQAYAHNVATLAAQKALAESVAFAGKTGFRPTQE